MIEVAIICALPREVHAVKALLDETYSRFCNGHVKHSRDVNVYTLGRMGKHNIVVCALPRMGKVNAAVAATNLRFSFPNIRLALLVGICGGVPFPSGGAPEIFLGDVLISDSMIEYDVGRQRAGGFHRTSQVKERLGGPETLLSLLTSSEVYSAFEGQLNKHLEDMQALDKKWLCPGISRDVIFEESNQHRNRTIERHQCTCDSGNSVNCPRHGFEETRPLRFRSSENSDDVSVHIGTFGCADRVMKSAQHRDLLAKDAGVLAVEMEGAGIWDNLPCVIIKGVCDYADNNKHKVWQNYAAATAAAAAKAFLGCWKHNAGADSSSRQKMHMAIPIPETAFFGRKAELDQIEQNLGWPKRGRKGVVLWGLGGYGKTRLASHYITMHKPFYDSILWIDSSSADSIHSCFAQVLSMIDRNVNEGQSAVEMVLEWLEQDLNPCWIIVFDGVDSRGDPNEPDYIDIEKYIPSCDHGHVLMTTASSDLHLRLNLAGIPVNGVDEQAGSEILLRWSGSSISDSSGAAKAISRRLGGVPLALEQAGSFLSYNIIPINEYNRQFERRFVETPFETPLCEYFESYETGRTLWTAFEILYDALSRRNSDSVKLLHFLAVHGRDQIPFSTISNLVSQYGESPGSPDLTWLLRLHSQMDDFASALRELEKSGFVKFKRKRSDTIIDGFFIHDMVRFFVQLKLFEEDMLDNAALAQDPAVAAGRPSTAMADSPQQIAPIAVKDWEAGVI
ncbi:hypothetical protein ACP6JD_000059 [Aspergillus fumigatus]